MLRTLSLLLKTIFVGRAAIKLLDQVCVAQ